MPKRSPIFTQLSSMLDLAAESAELDALYDAFDRAIGRLDQALDVLAPYSDADTLADRRLRCIAELGAAVREAREKLERAAPIPKDS